MIPSRHAYVCISATLQEWEDQIMEPRETELNKMRPRAHSIHVDNRMRISITGVMDVVNFNEQEVLLLTEAGPLNICGSNLHLSRLNLEDGQICVEGELVSIEYESEETEKRGLFGRVLR